MYYNERCSIIKECYFKVVILTSNRVLKRDIILIDNGDKVFMRNSSCYLKFEFPLNRIIFLI